MLWFFEINDRKGKLQILTESIQKYQQYIMWKVSQPKSKPLISWCFATSVDSLVYDFGVHSKRTSNEKEYRYQINWTRFYETTWLTFLSKCSNIFKMSRNLWRLHMFVTSNKIQDIKLNILSIEFPTHRTRNVTWLYCLFDWWWMNEMNR